MFLVVLIPIINLVCLRVHARRVFVFSLIWCKIESVFYNYIFVFIIFTSLKNSFTKKKKKIKEEGRQPNQFKTQKWTTKNQTITNKQIKL
jgi:hypothetical protein